MLLLTVRLVNRPLINLVEFLMRIYTYKIIRLPQIMPLIYDLFLIQVMEEQVPNCMMSLPLLLLILLLFEQNLLALGY